MASITKIGKRYRALVRKGDVARCMTFGTKDGAKSWADKIEKEIEQLKSSGFLDSAALTVGDLIDRYVREVYPTKPWSPSKTRDLRILRRLFGADVVRDISHKRIIDVFSAMHAEGAGGVCVSARIGYLIRVLETASVLWRINVPVDVVRGARSALKGGGMITASNERDRRVTDAEIAAVIAHLERSTSVIPMRDIVHFAVATGMRVAEITRIRWADLNERDRTPIYQK